MGKEKKGEGKEKSKRKRRRKKLINCLSKIPQIFNGLFKERWMCECFTLF
jgi:5-methylthioribose kinase